MGPFVQHEKLASSLKVFHLGWNSVYTKQIKTQFSIRAALNALQNNAEKRHQNGEDEEQPLRCGSRVFQ